MEPGKSVRHPDGTMTLATGKEIIHLDAQGEMIHNHIPCFWYGQIPFGNLPMWNSVLTRNGMITNAGQGASNACCDAAIL